MKTTFLPRTHLHPTYGEAQPLIRMQGGSRSVRVGAESVDSLDMLPGSAGFHGWFAYTLPAEAITVLD